MSAFRGRAVPLAAANFAALTGCGPLASNGAVAPPSPMAADPRFGPDEPQVGVAYPFDLDTHWEISITRPDSQTWQAGPTHPATAPSRGTVPPSGTPRAPWGLRMA